MSSTKFRLVQDHASVCQPWYRIEVCTEYGSWQRVASGSDETYIQKRFDDVVAGKPEFTVLREAELEAVAL